VTITHTKEVDMDERPSWSRRAFIALGAIASAATTVGSARRAAAHNLPPGEFGSAGYDRALLVDSGYRAVFQSPNIEASVQPPNTKRLDHLLLLQIKNWLNGFQFSYKARPDDLHVVSATYASANLLTYSDYVWQKYKLGEKYKITDPETGAPAVRNLFWASRFGPNATKEMDHPQSAWQDTGIEALQKRGVVFLT
jgi:hypothetical protein